jgi:hypothetical protein
MSSTAAERAEARKKAEERSAQRAAYRAKLKKDAETKAQVAERTLRTYRDKQATLTQSGNLVAKLAPRLLDSPDYAKAVGEFHNLRHRWLRPLEDWEPRGKGRETLFRSLAEHLFAKFKTPPFVWSVFFEGNVGLRKRLVDVVVSVASGASFYEEVKTGGLPVPLTRKMCHEVLTSSSEVTFLQAVRRVQVRTCGGDESLWRAWLGTSVGSEIESERSEIFWASVLEFLARNPMLDRAEVGPLVDFIRYRRGVEPTFSMKGRSANALLESMAEWHGELQAAKGKVGHVFNPSGFAPGEFDYTRENPRGGRLVEIWRISEILTGIELAREGRNNRHCVYSYNRSIESGMTSIWSMTREDNSGNWHALTVEVRNASKMIVQTRGMMNRKATGPEANVLSQWAAQNGLTVHLSSW